MSGAEMDGRGVVSESGLVPGPDEDAGGSSPWGRARIAGWALAASALAALSVVVMAGALGPGGDTDGSTALDAAAQQREQEIAEALRYDEPSPELAAALQEAALQQEAVPEEQQGAAPDVPGDPGEPAQPEEAVPPAQAARLEIRATGAPVDVTWMDGGGTGHTQRGLAGASDGAVWSVEIPAGDPGELPGVMVMAQLQGAGELSCAVSWSGRPVSTDTASGQGAAVMCALA